MIVNVDMWRGGTDMDMDMDIRRVYYVRGRSDLVVNSQETCLANSPKR